MNDNEAVIKIIGDASGVAPATEQATGEISGLSESIQQLSASMQSMSAQMVEAMGSMKAAIESTRVEVKHLEEEEERGLKAMAMSVHEGVESFNQFKLGLKEIAEVWMAAFAVERIEEWSKEIGEAAEKIKHLSEQFGMSTNEVQGFQAVAVATGVSIDTITRGMGIMDKALVNSKGSTSAQANAFKALGISIDDGKSQIDKFLTVADKFSKMEDGPKKAALAMEAFGRSGKELIPILNLGRDGIERLMEAAKEYDAANTEVSQRAQEKGMALAEAWNENKLAMIGVTNVLADAFAPLMTETVEAINRFIKAMVESYNSGGIVAIILNNIATSLELVGTIFSAVGQIFEAVWEVISSVASELGEIITDVFGVKTPSALQASEVKLNVLKDVITIVKDVFIIGIDSIGAKLQTFAGFVITFGKIVSDALHMNWGEISADWQHGLDAIDRQTAETAKHIIKSADEAKTAWNAMLKGEALPSPKHEALPEPKGSKDFDPSVGATHKGKEKKGPSVAEQLNQELEDKKTAWAMEQDAKGTFLQWSTQADVDFWAAALKRTDLTAKDKLEVERKYLAARQAMLKERMTAEGEASKLTAALANEAAKTEIDLARNALQQKIQIIDEEEKAHQITATRAAQMKADLNRQLYQLDQDLEQREYALKLKALQDELKILGEKPQYYRNVNDKIELLEKQHQDKMALLRSQASTKEMRDSALVLDTQRRIWQQTFQSFSQNIGQMMAGQQTFYQSIQGMWRGLQNLVARAIENMVENFLVGLAMQEAASAKAHAKEVMHAAKQAAAKAFHAVVGIPVVGPILAPVAAAAAFAAVMAYSAEGGDYRTKEGLYHLHEQEMVLPAHLATPMRSMIENGGSAGSAAGGRAAAAGGDNHLHYSPTINGQTPMDLKQVLRDQGDHLIDWMGSALRNGKLKIA